MSRRADPALTMARARNLIARNPDAWEFMTAMALHETMFKRKFGARWLVEESRKHSFIDADGEDYKINNDYCAALGRILLEQHPECAPYLRIRHSALDDLGEDAEKRNG